MKKSKTLSIIMTQTPFPNSELNDAAGQNKQQFQICMRPSRRSLQLDNVDNANT